MSKQALQLGDRVRLDLTEPATASLPVEARVADGVVWKMWLRHFGTEFENVSYTVRLGRPILGGYYWTVQADFGVVPRQLTLLEGGDVNA